MASKPGRPRNKTTFAPLTESQVGESPNFSFRGTVEDAARVEALLPMSGMRRSELLRTALQMGLTQMEQAQTMIRGIVGIPPAP